MAEKSRKSPRDDQFRDPEEDQIRDISDDDEEFEDAGDEEDEDFDEDADEQLSGGGDYTVELGSEGGSSGERQMPDEIERPPMARGSEATETGRPSSSSQIPRSRR